MTERTQTIRIDDPSVKVAFSFKDLETDRSTYIGRVRAMMKITNPRLFFVSD
jgi:hypothetical protein